MYIHTDSRELLQLETHHNRVVSLEFMYIEPQKSRPGKGTRPDISFDQLQCPFHIISPRCRWQFCKEVTAIAAGHSGAGPQVRDPNKNQQTKANTFDGEKSHKSSLWGKHQLVNSFSQLWGTIFLHSGILWNIQYTVCCMICLLYTLVTWMKHVHKNGQIDYIIYIYIYVYACLRRVLNCQGNIQDSNPVNSPKQELSALKSLQ